MRISGILALCGVVGAFFLVIITIIVLFQKGVNEESWWRFGLVFVGALLLLLKRKQVLDLIRLGVTGKYPG
jgi:hypothetical protein